MKMLPQVLFWLGLISVPFAWLVWYFGSFADGRIWRGDAVLNQTPVDLGIPFVHETEHPAFYRYQESYPRRNGSPRNCCSRADGGRSEAAVCA